MHASDDAIPILDLNRYLAVEPGADLRLAAELRRACEEVGFYFITNHGVPQRLIDAAFAETARFHAQKLAEPKYPPQTYGEFYAWFISRSYARQQDAAE